METIYLSQKLGVFMLFRVQAEHPECSTRLENLRETPYGEAS